MRDTVCAFCGREFVAKDAKTKYCSVECRRAQGRVDKILSAMRHGKKPRVILNNATGYVGRDEAGRNCYNHKCLYCGKDFRSSSQLTKYCSPECKRDDREADKVRIRDARKKREEAAQRLDKKEKEAQRLGVSYGRLQVLAAQRAAREKWGLK